ncbi:hypothetical protein HK101_002562 [Irineochytrium annulatum]|nr:hypothetical protein HK101_002562 [Irineochytrium annulatum]
MDQPTTTTPSPPSHPTSDEEPANSPSSATGEIAGRPSMGSSASARTDTNSSSILRKLGRWWQITIPKLPDGEEDEIEDDEEFGEGETQEDGAANEGGPIELKNPRGPEVTVDEETGRGGRKVGAWSRFLKFCKMSFVAAGTGGFIAVGYMDPGNWSTDLSGGARFGYAPLFVILFSNAIAVVLQSLAIRLGLVTGRSLAHQCRAALPKWLNVILWLLAELSIIATDLAEVIGTAIALYLLFGLPIPYGVLLTGLDVLIILAGWDAKYLRYYEAFILCLILGVGACFAVLIAKVSPNWGAAFTGYIPTPGLVTNSDELYLGLGILGATVSI